MEAHRRFKGDDMKNEKFAATLSVGDAAYTYYPIEQIAGSEKLPYALKVLLENVLRNTETPEAAADLAKRVIEAGCAGEVGSEVEFSPARWHSWATSSPPTTSRRLAASRPIPRRRST